MNRLQQYLVKPTVSNEDRSIEDNVPMSPLLLPIYTPLSAERVAELKAARPAPEKSLDLNIIYRQIKEVIFQPVEGKGVMLCVIELENGFHTYGESDPLAIENYNEELAKHYAYMKAFEDLIPIGAYLQYQQWHTTQLENAAPKETPAVEEGTAPVGEVAPPVEQVTLTPDTERKAEEFI